MSETDAPQVTPTRVGSSADLALRMDRMERRQDTMETTLASTRETVARVELNQKHAEELNALRHDALKTGLDTLTGTVGAFITRVEGIVDGSIQTSQTRQGQEMVSDYIKWRATVDQHMDDSAVLHASQAARQGGIVIALSGVKAAVLVAIGLAGPVIALIGLLTRP